jgi:acyl-CoA thioester hydrolase
VTGLKHKDVISAGSEKPADTVNPDAAVQTGVYKKDARPDATDILFPDTQPIFHHTVHIRSRYGETDKMGYLYHARFIDYFDVARTEMIRLGDIDYKKLEDSGIIMPVLDVRVRYFEPVFYDEEVRVLVHVYEWPLTRLHTHYKVTSSAGGLKAYGKVSLCFVNEQTRKPVRAPKSLLDAMRRYVQH